MKRPAPETFPEKSHLPPPKQESIKPVSPPSGPSQAVQLPKPAGPSDDAPSSPVVKPSARMMASANLVDQGKDYLDKGKPDRALRAFERALSLYSGDGEIYYYMAEAWMMKKNKHQALEFNRLAGMYLSGNYLWSDKVAEQQKRIKQLP